VDDVVTVLAERLDRRVVTQWRLTTVPLALALGAAAVGAALVAGAVAAVVAALVALALAVALAWAYPAAAWRAWSFAVTDEAVEVRHGVLGQVHSVVPHFRVQHVALERGVVERRLGLASLTIHTASAGSDADIPGLPPDRAEAIRTHVLARTAAGDAV
jgi:membrane protein YdbS with pleckstrin-like domain